jgi:hypothetical protein
MSKLLYSAVPLLNSNAPLRTLPDFTQAQQVIYYMHHLHLLAKRSTDM